MASLGAAVSGVTRPLRHVVKPSRIAAEHPMRMAKPQTALVAAPTSLAAPAAVSGHHCTKEYPWGVTWPAKSVAASPDFDPQAVKKSFKKWKEFNLNGDEWIGAFTMTAIDTAMFVIPGKKF
mmetsp:Transcript_57957/g.111784  ORF Transcript_57957/g.111784 Transcript_57957/m.111784 type:complete len:122 (+) Transcript_57957:100-465(+)